jgi:hypothetical protein
MSALLTGYSCDFRKHQLSVRPIHDSVEKTIAAKTCDFSRYAAVPRINVLLPWVAEEGVI